MIKQKVKISSLYEESQQNQINSIKIKKFKQKVFGKLIKKLLSKKRKKACGLYFGKWFETIFFIKPGEELQPDILSQKLEIWHK